MNYTTVTDLEYADASGERINCKVDFGGSLGVVPFTAYLHDTTTHGVEIFNRAVAGDFGAVAPFVPHVDTPEEIAEKQRRADKAEFNEKALAAEGGATRILLSILPKLISSGAINLNTDLTPDEVTLYNELQVLKGKLWS